MSGYDVAKDSWPDQDAPKSPLKQLSQAACIVAQRFGHYRRSKMQDLAVELTEDDLEVLASTKLDHLTLSQHALRILECLASQSLALGAAVAPVMEEPQEHGPGTGIHSFAMLIDDETLATVAASRQSGADPGAWISHLIRTGAHRLASARGKGA
tara:strand:+ start:11462 stop:11926 length:465 start_codon:yes stop_codon:yes gene_type:complete